MPLSVPQISGLAPKVNPLIYEALRTIATQAVSAANLTSVSGPTLGGTGTKTAFTAGSVVFAGAGGAYTQDDGALYFDPTRNYFGVGTNAPDSTLTVNANTGSSFPQPPSIPCAFHLVGADGTANRGVIDSFQGSVIGSSSVFFLRNARGTAVAPSANQSGDTLGRLGGTGYGATGYHAGVAAYWEFDADENWTDSAHGTSIRGYTIANGTTLGREVFRITNGASTVVGGGSGSALATTATDGFLYIPTCAGTPTGVPTAFTGRVPMVYDTTANKFWIYRGGAWAGVAI
jgi:hypothetical protein